MTVKELKAELEKFPDDYEVEFGVRERDYFRRVYFREIDYLGVDRVDELPLIELRFR